MSTIPITNSWPATLPLPFVEYTGGVRPPVAVSRPASARSKRRQRWVTGYALATMTWKLSRIQYTAFQTFWETTLGNGAAQFDIDLRYPKISELATWIIQFVDDVEVTTEDNGIINVAATVQLKRPTAIADKAAALENFFLVQGEASSAAPTEGFFVQGVGSSAAPTEQFGVQES